MSAIASAPPPPLADAVFAHRGTRRRRLGIAAVLTSALAMAGAYAYYVDRLDSPEVRRVTETYYAFSPALPMAEVSHTFVIENPSDDTLEFQELRVSCSCTRGDLEETVIPPHSSTHLLVSMITPNSDLSTRQWIRLRGVCGATPIDLRYRLTAVAASMVTMPKDVTAIDLGDGRAGQTELLTSSVILSRGPFPAEWTDVRCSTDSESFMPTVARIDPDHWRLTVSYRPADHIGPLTAHATLHFFNGTNPLPQELVENITARVTGPIGAAPSALLFGLVKSGATVTRTVQLSGEQSLTPRELEQMTIESSSPQIKVDRPSSATPDQLLVHYTAGDPNEEDKGSILIHVGEARHYVLSIRYLAKVLPKENIGEQAH